MKKYDRLTLTEIKPSGWFYKQLQIQMNGLSGKLYEIWDSVGSYSGWLGGTGDGWERAPYYLDGLLPLSYYLDDKAHWDLCMKFIEWTLQSQDESGNFGPLSPGVYLNPSPLRRGNRRQGRTHDGDVEAFILTDGRQSHPRRESRQHQAAVHNGFGGGDGDHPLLNQFFGRQYPVIHSGYSYSDVIHRVSELAHGGHITGHDRLLKGFDRRLQTLEGL